MLKTLKDLDLFDPKYEGNRGLIRNDLRQSAIEWIKYLKDIEPMFLIHANQMEVNKGIKNWIKNFFNITEEEIEANKYIENLAKESEKNLPKIEFQKEIKVEFKEDLK